MSTTPAITVEHNGIAITYDEARNLFCFELRGRQRTTQSLAKAREAIDKPVKEKTKPFERFKAWFNGSSYGGDDWQQIEVTSIGEPKYGRNRVWAMVPSNRKWSTSPTRQQIDPENIFPVNPKHDALVAEMMKLSAEAQALKDKANALRKKMTPYAIPPEEEDDE